ncbi:hypothetical protein, partial [Klebsiella oxytoca]|uniref:hypothetical protein n=1 Tax=Klebsiella oxytoca TaxID=571 RepID=UPI001CC985DE
RKIFSQSAILQIERATFFSAECGNILIIVPASRAVFWPAGANQCRGESHPLDGHFSAPLQRLSHVTPGKSC